MKTKPISSVLIVFSLILCLLVSVSLVGCSPTPVAAPVPAPEVTAPAPVPAPETPTAPDPAPAAAPGVAAPAPAPVPEAPEAGVATPAPALLPGHEPVTPADPPPVPAPVAPAPAPGLAPRPAPAPAPAAPGVAAPAPAPAPAAGPLTAEPKRGGVLRIAIASPIQNIGLNTDMRTVTDFFVSWPALQTLGVHDEKGEMQPFLAERWITDPPNRTITYELRRGVQFHDGTAFNAEAVKWNLERHIRYRSELRLIEDIKVVDDYTLVVTLREWNGNMIEQIGNFGVISSPTSFQKLGRDASLMNPVGTGPFKFESFRSGEYIHYVRNDNYWKEGKPYLDRIEFILFADSITATLAMQAKEVDAFFMAPPISARELRGTPGVEIELLRTGVGAMMTGIIYDSRNPDSPFANAKVRRAITHAIDRETLVETVLHGFSTPTSQWGIRGNPAYHPALDLEYDPAKARRLLAEAGFPDGFKTTYTTLSDPAAVEFATAVRGFLRAVGIETTLNVVDAARSRQLTVAAEGHRWNGIIGWTTRADYDLGLFMPRNFSPRGTTFAHNIQHFDDMQLLYVRLRRETNMQEWRRVTRELQRLAFDTYAIATPIHVSLMPFPVSRNVRDHGFNVGHPTRFTPESIWLERH